MRLADPAGWSDPSRPTEVLRWAVRSPVTTAHSPVAYLTGFLRIPVDEEVLNGPITECRDRDRPCGGIVAAGRRPGRAGRPVAGSVAGAGRRAGELVGRAGTLPARIRWRGGDCR